MFEQVTIKEATISEKAIHLSIQKAHSHKQGNNHSLDRSISTSHFLCVIPNGKSNMKRETLLSSICFISSKQSPDNNIIYNNEIIKF